MAARLNKRHDEEARNKIQVSQLVNRLQANALGKLKSEMSPGQVKSATALLAKRLPDLKAIEHTGQDGAPIEHKITRVEIVAADGNRTG